MQHYNDDDNIYSFSDFIDADQLHEDRNRNKHSTRYNADTRRKIDEKLERRRLKEELGYYDS